MEYIYRNLKSLPDKHGRSSDGVDNNGSGVVALLMTARRLAKKRLKRSVIFAAFDLQLKEQVGKAVEKRSFQSKISHTRRTTCPSFNF